MMDADGLMRIVDAAAIESGGKKRLPCARAFELAVEHSVPIGEIGKSCNRSGIKIIRCQLGCFE
jgi:hypothetical protein